MIKLGNKEISAIRLGNNVISAVYKGSVLIWQAIRSCFGSGWWVNENTSLIHCRNHIIS